MKTRLPVLVFAVALLGAARPARALLYLDPTLDLSGMDGNEFTMEQAASTAQETAKDANDALRAESADLTLTCFPSHESAAGTFLVVPVGQPETGVSYDEPIGFPGFSLGLSQFDGLESGQGVRWHSIVLRSRAPEAFPMMDILIRPILISGESAGLVIDVKQVEKRKEKVPVEKRESAFTQADGIYSRSTRTQVPAAKQRFKIELGKASDKDGRIELDCHIE